MGGLLRLLPSPTASAMATTAVSSDLLLVSCAAGVAAAPAASMLSASAVGSCCNGGCCEVPAPLATDMVEALGRSTSVMPLALLAAGSNSSSLSGTYRS